MAKGKKKEGVKSFFVVLLLVALIYGGWWIFNSYDECETKACFDEHLKSCERARFIGGDKMIFEYKILGESEGSCNVETMLLQGELNNRDSVKLEGLKMICGLPKGVAVVPESDMSVCHGLLKEGLQDLIIEKMHAYLVKNVGKINFAFS
jgi:hypothetical protein